MPSRFHGHAYRIYERIAPKLIEDRVLFIGDAAGLAYPQSGEGIRPAVESGLMAADVLIAVRGQVSPRESRALLAGDYRSVRHAATSGAISDRLPTAFLQFAARSLLANRWFTRHVVLDQWFLHAETPALSVSQRMPDSCGVA